MKNIGKIIVKKGEIYTNGAKYCGEKVRFD
jgi:hypothetical protein